MRCTPSSPKANFVFVNWLAPCTIKNSVMSGQSAFVAASILGEPRNFGAALLPIFSYKKGQLWTIEAGAIRSLAMSGLNVDSCWNMCFHKKVPCWGFSLPCQLLLHAMNGAFFLFICFFLPFLCFLACQVDTRDGRPCNYPGRVLLHPTLKDKMWQNVALLRTGRTEPCDMLHSRDMLSIEDVSADALPSTVDDDAATVQGAKKYEQAGCLFLKFWSLVYESLFDTGPLHHLHLPCSSESKPARSCWTAFWMGCRWSPTAVCSS